MDGMGHWQGVAQPGCVLRLQRELFAEHVAFPISRRPAAAQ